MSSEYTLEQEITLLEQDYALLTETQAELQQHVETELEKKSIIQQKIVETEQELNEVKQRLEQLKQEAGLVPTQRTTAISPATLYNVPTLPSYLVINLPIFNELKAKLVIKPSLAEIAEGQKNPLLIQSPSGMGKSVMAAILAHDAAIRRTFVDGIFWIHLGQQPDLITAQITLIRALGESMMDFLDPEEGTAFLRNLCAKRSCLFILDDVWDVTEVLAFNALGKYCQLFITTCDTTLLDFLKHSVPNLQGHTLNPLAEEQAIQFFTHCAQQNLTTMPIEVNAMARACDYLPLTLKLMATFARTQPLSHWQTLLESLQNAKTNEFPDTHPRALMQAMQLNVDALGEHSEYYLALAVFANYTNIPQATVIMLWQYLYHLPIEQAYTFINQLTETGLLHIDGLSPDSHISLHAFQHDYLYTCTEVEKLHPHLLAAYRRHCSHGWPSGPNDGYFFEYLAIHLLAAERTNELKSLLLDFDWLSTKLKICQLHQLLKDFDLLPDPELDQVKQALHKAAPILRTDREQLADQLLHYLSNQPSPGIQKLLNQVKEMSPDWQPSN